MTLFEKAKKISLSRLMALALLFIVAMTVASCGDEYYEYSPLEGSWELVEIDDYRVLESEVSEFTFYSDGTGVYGQYLPYPRWNASPITWEVDYTGAGAEYLYIHPYTGGTWSYMLRLYPSYMELTDLLTGQRLIYKAR